MSVLRYIVAGCKPWNRRLFDSALRSLPGEWTFVATPAELTPELVAALAPRYVFFLHWSWKVPAEIVDGCECVCFHMTDVPYGRGGSPLQNLIARGHRDTKLTALRMVADFDAGPVYLKEPLSLEGSAEEIYLRAGELSARMIARLVAGEPAPVPQTGEPVVFRRRKPAESALPAGLDLARAFDHIRMLDADGYPPAFVDAQGFRFTFTRAALRDGRIVADVSITALPNSAP